ncbi:thiamine diphosphokinase [bacterium]|nr:thiamine diphosphokinase [bacterium]
MRVLLVLAGSPPRPELLETEIKAADLVVAIDGGANIFQQLNLTPDLIIGDLDSTNYEFDSGVEVVQKLDPNLTDLQKTLNYLDDKYDLNQIVILGAMGGRSDHFINNLHICARVHPRISIMFKNDISIPEVFKHETITRIMAPYDSDLPVIKGSTVSIFTIIQFNGLSSTGLKWDLNNVNSDSDFLSQSNIAEMNDPRFRLESGCAYIAVYQ